ncbi:MAG: hypothetical protein WBQ86_02090 [Candidatus Binatus sp.]
MAAAVTDRLWSVEGLIEAAQMNSVFWQHLPTSVEVVMLLVASGVFVKWVVDDFRHSRVSAITWLLFVSSVFGFILAAKQLSIEFRQRRDLIQLQVRAVPENLRPL